ncbi:replication-associated recombination protein A [Aestuariibacter halophilus]|uniref:Replication-associated recombination protein A n=1 Tax=Fluctibacter halophilus TaxID=226011 RepID=A0ABS8G6Q1_9ALTE|nr:replication-associated recombination protein A [Aestuariibacter halophilus]MCC2615756.1 replication-associated recombination protein A [Aestuariibacter halophilus]
MTSANTEFSFGDEPQFAPLAARMRPRTIDEYLGQQHIVGQDKPLRNAIIQGHAHSMILWGPPGTGKTTLAELIAHHCDAHVQRISAVTAGVKDIRAAIEQARHVGAARQQRTILFVDEVHRFNKSQQDAFLPHIEDGTVLFIGATTENPSFELNNALLSRARVYVLKPLTQEDLLQVVESALSDQTRGLGGRHLTMDDETRKHLVDLAGGDARRVLNYLELCADFARDNCIDRAIVNDAVGAKVAQFDKGGDQYYDILSAFHKSVRGSSADGALYWYARLLEAGGDPLVIARRLLAIASEDIGNADPRALEICLNAWDIFHRVGAAEGERAIAQAAVFCALAAKSNAVYTAFKAARKLAQETPDAQVPAHLRNAPTDLLAEQGYGADYRYAHDEPGAYAAGENYLPASIKDARLYFPNDRGLEKQLQQKMAYLDSCDQQSQRKRYP